MSRTKVPFKTGFVVTFLAGIVSAPYVKPFFRRVIKLTVGGAMRAKKVAAGAAEELQDIVAEAKATDVAPNDKQS